MKKISFLLCILLFAGMLFTGCGNSEMKRTDASDDMAEKEVLSPAESGYSINEEKTDISDITDFDVRKLIKTVSLMIETKEFDSFISSIDSKISEVGAYTESSDISGNSYNSRTRRNASIKIRVPADKLEQFIQSISGIGNVVSKSESIEDVTMTYVDIESRIKSLETEMKSLLSILEKADNVTDVMNIQSRITDVRYELERYESQKRTYDSLISYSTVNISASEVEKETPITELGVWEQIGNNLSENTENIRNAFTSFFIWFVSSIPYIAIWLIVLAIALVTVIIYKKKRKAKNPPIANNSEDKK